MQLSTTVRNSISDSIDDDIGATGHVRFFVSGGATPTTKCASATLNNPAFDAAGTGGAGVIQLDVTPAIEDTSPAAAGTVTRLCFYTSATAADNTWLLQLGIATGGAPDVTMANNTIATTDTVQISSLTITCPEGTPDVT